MKQGQLFNTELGWKRHLAQYGSYIQYVLYYIIPSGAANLRHLSRISLISAPPKYLTLLRLFFNNVFQPIFIRHSLYCNMVSFCSVSIIAPKWGENISALFHCKIAKCSISLPRSVLVSYMILSHFLFFLVVGRKFVALFFISAKRGKSFSLFSGLPIWQLGRPAAVLSLKWGRQRRRSSFLHFQPATLFYCEFFPFLFGVSRKIRSCIRREEISARLAS